jgi:hypothetical protein
MNNYRWTKALIVFLAFIVGLYVAVRIGVFVVIYQLQIPALVLSAVIVLGLTIRVDRQTKKETCKEETQPE